MFVSHLCSGLFWCIFQCAIPTAPVLALPVERESVTAPVRLATNWFPTPASVGEALFAFSIKSVKFISSVITFDYITHARCLEPNKRMHIAYIAWFLSQIILLLLYQWWNCYWGYLRFDLNYTQTFSAHKYFIARVEPLNFHYFCSFKFFYFFYFSHAVCNNDNNNYNSRYSLLNISAYCSGYDLWS